MRRHFFGALAVALGLAASGCGGSEKGVKVTGSVTKGNRPLEGVLVSFCSADDKPDWSKAARTDASGKFELLVKPGAYVVTLSRKVDKKGNLPKESEDPNEDAGQLEASERLVESIPEKYREPGSSPLGIEIPSEGKELPPFDVSK